jgi:hypothetical protein
MATERQHAPDDLVSALEAWLAMRALRHTLVLAIGVCLLVGCSITRHPVHPELRSAAEQQSALDLSDALEALIAEGKDTAADREFAYQVVKAHDGDTAASTYARAAITGRLVQQKGLLGANMVGDVERYARRSRDLDPDFRDGAATRLLGTLYVLAPATLLEHGDSESGLVLLERLVQAHPDALENHLRVAEAYIALNDPAPATPHLCRCLAGESALRPDDRRLLANLVAMAGAPQRPPSR